MLSKARPKAGPERPEKKDLDLEAIQAQIFRNGQSRKYPINSGTARIRVNTFCLRQTNNLFIRFLAGSFLSASMSSLSNKRELSTGINVMAMSTETISAKEMVRAKSRNKRPAIPGTKRIGRKTTSVVRVETITGAATS